MKYCWYALRLLLPVAAIVLLALYSAGKGGNPNLLLSGGLVCSSLGIWLNIWCQRKERKERQ